MLCHLPSMVYGWFASFSFLSYECGNHHTLLSLFSEPLILSQSVREQFLDILKRKLISGNLKLLPFAMNVKKCKKNWETLLKRTQNAILYIIDFTFTAFILCFISILGQTYQLATFIRSTTLYMEGHSSRIQGSPVDLDAICRNSLTVDPWRSWREFNSLHRAVFCPTSYQLELR